MWLMHLARRVKQAQRIEDGKTCSWCTVSGSWGIDRYQCIEDGYDMWLMHSAGGSDMQPMHSSIYNSSNILAD